MKLFELKCENCKRVFYHKRNETKYCSKDCRKEDQSKKKSKKVEVGCSFCGEIKLVKQHELKLYKNHFCNKECHGEWNSQNKVGENHPAYSKIEVECAWCGTSKLVKSSQLDRSEKFFCDPKCHGKWKTENPVEIESILVECSWCGKTKKTISYHINRSDKHFCNAGCHGLWKSKNNRGENSPTWQGGKVKTKCSYCGREIEVFPYKLEIYQNNFCDIKCRNKWQSDFMTGEGSPAWQGGKSFEEYPSEFSNRLKEAIRERDEFKCQLCGAGEEKENHSAHHIDYTKSNCSFYNLISLCRSCHGKTSNGDRLFYTEYLQMVIKEKYQEE